jgi:ABC-type transporter Mla MlaB component
MGVIQRKTSDMTKTSVSMPADLLAWTHAEAKKRDSSASRLICDLIELERRASVFVRLEALERKVKELENNQTK